MPLKKAMMNMLHKLHLDGEDLHKKGYLQGESLEQWKREISEIEENGSLSPRNGDNPFGTMPNIEVDTATKRWYNWDTKSWETAKISVRVSPEPFTTGSERAVHAMLLVPPNAEEQQCVAKRMREAKADVQGKYENDVIRQAECQHIAEAFNKLEPAKKVYFLDTYMMHHKGSWWTVEKYLTGRMISHNDAHGFVEPMQRNTPQAFSHYSHHYSEGKFIIVGIKGVGDVYTNPQIHTKNGQGFGFGNLGPAGIQQFFQTHICNQICEKLGLKSYMALGTGVNNIKRTGTECPKGTVQEKLGIMEYIGDVQPRADGIRKDDLAFLGINSKQFATLGNIWLNVDTTSSGYVDKGRLFDLFSKARTFSAPEKAQGFVQFCARIDPFVDPQGRVSFKAFVVTWTGNA